MLQINVPLRREVKGNPEAERLPRRFREEARLCDRPESARAEDFTDAAPLRRARGLSADDRLALGRADARVIGRRTVQHIPGGSPHEAERTGHRKRALPAI